MSDVMTTVQHAVFPLNSLTWWSLWMPLTLVELNRGEEQWNVLLF